MKNKEIEELLNDMRHSYEIHEEIIKKYNNADKISYPYRINLKQIKLLLSYIEQLEKKGNDALHYESKYYNEAKKVDKAIEYIEWQRDNPQCDNVWRKHECESLINILGDTSD